jgi:FkbM family methyltransferase
MPHSVCYKIYGQNFHIEPDSVQFANAVFHDEYRINDLRSHNVRTILDIGSHVGSFTAMAHHYWPNARIVAVEPHPQSFELLTKNTSHIPDTQLLRINAAISPKPGKCLLSFPVSNSRVADYVPDVWESLEPRYRDFGVEVPSLTVEQFWTQVSIPSTNRMVNGSPFLGSNSIGVGVGRWFFLPIELASRFSSSEVDNLPIPPDHNGRTGPLCDFNRLKPCIATGSSHFFIH